eukprot:219836-Chlamydomonas_euryale.AAC.2
MSHVTHHTSRKVQRGGGDRDSPACERWTTAVQTHPTSHTISHTSHVTQHTSHITQCAWDDALARERRTTAV